MTATLTDAPAAARDQFIAEGYTVLRRFFDPAQVRQLADEVERYTREDLPGLPASLAFFEDKRDPATLFRLSHLEKHNLMFARLMLDDRLVGLARTLLNDAVSFEGVQMFGKAPRIGNETPAHQDGYYFMLDPNEALTMWLPLDRTDEGNGCIRYVRSSHRRGLRPHGKSKVFGFSQGVMDFGDADRANEVAVTADPGDLIVHHSLTIHRADPNRSDRRRWALGLTYYARRARKDEAKQKAYHEALLQEWAAAGKT